MIIRTGVSTRAIVCILAILLLLSAASVAFVKNADAALLDKVTDRAGSIASPVRSLGTASENRQNKATTETSLGGVNGQLIFGRVLSEPRLAGSITAKEPSGSSTPVTLTNNHEYEPAWSPDGKKIVFISMRDGIDDFWYPEERRNREIYIMNADGTDQRRLTYNGTAEANPTFSPDGTKILFVGMVGGDEFGEVGVFSMNTDGSAQTLLVDETCVPVGSLNTKNKKRQSGESNFYPGFLGIDAPSYSPDMTNIIFGVGFGSNEGIYRHVIGVPGCSLLYFNGNNSVEARYSPDGTKIAVNGYQEMLDIIDANGNFLVGYNPIGYDGYSTPAWSPDGTKIAFLGDITEWGPSTVRVFDLMSENTELVYAGSESYFYLGLSWGNPTNVVPPITLSISPYSIVGPQSVQGSIQMDPATFPSVGGVVDLSIAGSAGVLSLPQTSVTIPPGSTSATFTIDTLIQPTYNSADVIASYGGETARATVTVRPPKPDLTVTNVTVPANVTLGTAFNVTWTTRNISPSPMTNNYRDEIFFSRDNVWDAGDTQLTFVNSSPLAGNSERTLTRSVTVSGTHNPESGLNYIIVVTNRNRNVDEGEGYSNNSLAQSFQMPLPDLVAENLVVPLQSEPGVPYTLTFTIRNAGTVSTGTSSQVQIWFSEDNVAGNSDDIQVIAQFSQATLAAGATTSTLNRNVTIPTVPVRNSGPAYFYVKVDAGNTIAEGASTGQTNNETFAPTTFSYLVPDLQVPTSSVAADVDTDTAFPLSWTTTNSGNKATAANLVDRVYLSTDQTVGGGDVTLQDFILTGGLADGASANRIQNITIAYANVPASGTYYLLIQTDATTLVNEGVNEGNNVRVQPVYVRKALRPDLVVTNVTAPPTVFFDQTVQVQWTVTNNATGPTNAPQWTDAVFIATSSTGAGATKLAEPASITALNPGESYTAIATVKIPRGFNGGYFFVVKTNNNNAVNETSTANNLLSRPVTVNVPPLPDLIVESVQAPDELFGGQEILVNYTIRNIGTEDATSRKDRIYLSRDTTLSTSQDRLIFTSDWISGPAAGQATSHLSRNRNGVQEPAVYINARVPSDAEGLWYVFVVTDYQNSVYEYTAENNNTGRDTEEPGSPMNILVTPPDLVVPDQLTAPATAESGGSIPVEFIVRNQGAFNASANLYHAVYMSTNATFEPGTDPLLATFKDTTFFAPGAEHTIALNVGFPNCLANGTYYLFAVADYNNYQFEFDPGFDAEANNASPAKQITLSTIPPDLQITNFTVPPITEPGGSVPLSWTVVNSGSATTRNWVDRIYLHSLTPGVSTQTLGSFTRNGGLIGGASYTASTNVGLPSYMEGQYFLTVVTDAGGSIPECGIAEDNNTAQSANFTVQNNLPDLVVDSVTAPTAGTVGDTFNVSWIGRNANQQMPSNSSSFRDTVYLSSDTNLSNNDIGIGSTLNNLILGAGQTYPQQTNVSIGNVTPGTYYILVSTDSSRNIYEGTSGSGFESNNVRASAPITLSAPAVDLTVGSVSMSSPQHSGTFRDFSWTVTNVGTSATLASSWTDYVILSRDSILDPADTTLGYRTRTGALAGGANYVATASFFVPVGLTGDYTIFVLTDRNNSVVESNNANNTATPLLINLTLPPPAELSITNITPPATASVGGTAIFNWTVQNTGANAINGIWRDTFYFSQDQFWDASDTLVGVRDLNSQTTNVPASGGTYTATWGGVLPPVEEGTYYVIVRTDAQNRIRESNEANNVATSVSTTTITVTQLTLNTPFNTTLGNGGQLFFKYATDPAETLLFKLDTNTPFRSNEVFTKFDTMVSRADYDFQSTRPGEGNQENVIDPTQDGDYYSMVRTDLIPESFASNFAKEPAKDLGNSVTPQNITVEAKILPFSIRKVSPEVLGNAGYGTIVVEGAKFQPGATMKLVKAGSPDVVPENQRAVGNKVVGMFDLTGEAAGEYDVVVTNPGNQTATLEDGFEIISGGGAAEPRISISGPGAARGGRLRYTISMSNDGLNDLYMVPMLITMPSRYAYQLDQSNVITDFSEYYAPDAVPSQIPMHVERDGLRVMSLTTPVLGSKRTVRVNIDLIVPFGFSGYEITALAMPPLAEWYEMGRDAQEEFVNRQLRNLNTPEKCEIAYNNCLIEVLRGLFFTVLAELIPAGCAGEVYKAVLSFGDYAMGIIMKGDNANLWDAVSGTGNMLMGAVAGIAQQCLEYLLPWFKAVDAAIKIFKLLYDFYDCYRQYVDCVAPPPEKFGTIFLGSFDPNEKIGPTGYGGEKWVPVGQPLDYRINFENLSSATAPAQLIRITDSLPPPLDLRTVRLKEIGFKQYRFVMPENQSFYQGRVQLGEDLGNLQADILAGVDLVNNRIFWNLQAIDPNTGEAPLDPLAGLLPPNNENKDGEGYVIFTVEAKSSFPNRTMINNTATIVFDENEPIVTNATANMLDSVVPTSQIAALPATSTVPEIELNWSGTDDADGSGFKGHSIVYSENGGGYRHYLNSQSDLSTTFSGKWGKSYNFYSIGRDNAGNVERAPSQPDATIRILGGDTEGDVAPRPNGSDGSVNGDDLTQVRRFIAKLDSAMQYNEFQRADMAPKADGGDGSLSVADVMQARRYVAGTDPIAGAVGPNEVLNLAPKAIAGKTGNLLPREVKPITIIRQGNQIEVGIVLETQGDETGLGFGLNFDPAVLSNPVVNLRPIASGGTLTLNTAQVAAGKLGVLLDKAPNQPLVAGTNVLMTITFNIALGSPATTQITFGDDPIKREVVNGLAEGLNTTFSPGTINLLAPTSANVSISGRVLKADGTPIKGARLILSGTQTGRTSVLSNAFGYFTFNNVAVGQTYTLSTSARGYTFTPRSIMVTDEISGLEITPDP